MVFKTAKLDTVAVVVTTCVCALLIALSVLFIIRVPYGWLWTIGMMLIPAVSCALSPRQYIFDGSHLIIRKAIGRTITIPVGDIQGYTIVPNLTKIKMIRVFGNGGLFGYYGMFSMAGYGPVNCQLTRMKQVVIVQTTNIRYALSPRDIDGFTSMLGSTASCRATTLEPVQPHEGAQAGLTILILPIVVYVATVIAILLAYRALPDRIAVHFNAVGTPDRWGSKVSYLLSGLIPSSILFAINCGIYFAMRRTTHERTLPVLLVVLVSWIQIFTLFIQLDIYWLNTCGVHMIPFTHTLVIFVGVLAVLLGVYYRIATVIKRRGV